MQLAGKDNQPGDDMAQPQLTYCTNIHAGESWQQHLQSLRDCVPAIRERLGTSQLGIGLRLGGAAIESLQSPEAREELIDFMGEDYSVFTINAFPFGPFHGEPVKENVYAPDWSTAERLDYTVKVAELLSPLVARHAGNNNFGSISTVPGTFKPLVKGREEAIRQNLVQCVARLVQIKRDSGVEIALALEPEPYCMLETIDETVDWFKNYGFSKESCNQLANLSGVSPSEADQLLRTHLGVCYDVCHAAVEFEDARASFADLKSAGITIPKVQLSSALRVRKMDRETAVKLSEFNEPVYLHQVIQRADMKHQSSHELQSLTRHLDLPQALKELENGVGVDSEWRVHFHVPVFLDVLEHFDTTQFFLKEVLAELRENAVSPHLEVETYTWDVLPEKLRTSDIATAIAREMTWVLDELQCKPAHS